MPSSQYIIHLPVDSIFSWSPFNIFFCYDYLLILSYYLFLILLFAHSFFLFSFLSLSHFYFSTIHIFTIILLQESICFNFLSIFYYCSVRLYNQMPIYLLIDRMREIIFSFLIFFHYFNLFFFFFNTFVYCAVAG